MASVGDEIVNPRNGERMVFRTLTRELAEIETWNPPTATREPEHVHPHQEQRFRVLAGTERLSISGRERDFGPGESFSIPAGTPHHHWNQGKEEVHWIQYFTPALNIAAFFETYFALARDGKLDERGMPTLLQLAVMVPAFAEEIRPTNPPWPLLKATSTVIAPLARLRGYRATHPYHAESSPHSALVSG
jgi:quercetin dioxygenase-like cupin family protein